MRGTKEARGLVYATSKDSARFCIIISSNDAWASAQRVATSLPTPYAAYLSHRRRFLRSREQPLACALDGARGS
eukprot:10942387-Alexandrium_andersonii.AAC.1